MATTDHQKERWLVDQAPHTANALTKLIMAMASVQKNLGKKTIFGHDKGLSSYQKFEQKFRDLLSCMILDGLISMTTESDECLAKVVSLIGFATEVWPNWPDAYAFANEFFVENSDQAERRINQLM